MNYTLEKIKLQFRYNNAFQRDPPVKTYFKMT